MKCLTSTLKIVGLVSVTLSLGGCFSASTTLQAHPGYADLSLPDRSQVNSTLSLSLGSVGLIPARWLVSHAVADSAEAGEEAKRLTRAVLQAVEGVQLRVYDVDNNTEMFDGAINESVSNLKAAGWQTLVTVKEANERVVIMQAGEDEMIVGLSVLVSNPDEAIFVNVVGQLKPEDVVLLAGNSATH